MIILDEAAREMKLEYWSLFARYPNTMGRIFIDDPFQLRPVVEFDATNNNFAAQLRVSLQTRLMTNEFSSTMLSIQY